MGIAEAGFCRNDIGCCFSRNAAGLAEAGGRAVAHPVGGLHFVAGGVVGGIGQLIKIGCRLDDRLDLRVGIDIVRAQVLDHVAVGVVVHTQHQAGQAFVLVIALILVDIGRITLDINVFIADQFVPVIVLTGNIDAHEVVVIMAFLLQANGKDHLLPTVLVAVKVAGRDRLYMGVADNVAPGSIVAVVEVTHCMHRLLGGSAAYVKDLTGHKEHLSGTHAAKGHGFRHDFAPAAVIAAVETAYPPAVGVHIVGAAGHKGHAALAVDRSEDPLHVPILVIHGDLSVHLGAVVLHPCGSTGTHHKEVIHGIPVEVAADQAGRRREGVGPVITVPDIGNGLSGLVHHSPCLIGSVDHLYGGAIAIQGDIRNAHSMAVGEDGQVIDLVAVEVAGRHGDRQLIGRVLVTPVDGALEVRIHQKPLGLLL